MRVAFNASVLMSPVTGIGQYARNLARCLASANADLDIEYFVGFGWSRTVPERPMSGIGAIKRIVKAVVPNPYWVTRLLQQSRFSTGARTGRFDLYHEPSFLAYRFDGPIVLTVHDLSHLRFPSTHPSSRVRNLEKLLPASLDRASRIITDSEFIRKELIAEFGLPAQKVVAIALAASASYGPRPAPSIEGELNGLGLKYKQYVLAVGTLEPRKNLGLALRAYCRLPAQMRRRYPLVVAGMKGWLTDDLDKQMRKLIDDGELKLLGYVGDSMLPALYAGASVLVYPSLYEGFGLPPLEAMASGTPVISSAASSLPEVVGDAALSVDPHDEDAVNVALQSLLGSPAEQARLSRIGLERARMFSWEKCAQETLMVYRDVLKGSGGHA